jgi:hypothetical protein
VWGMLPSAIGAEPRLDIWTVDPLSNGVLGGLKSNVMKIEQFCHVPVVQTNSYLPKNKPLPVHRVGRRSHLRARGVAQRLGVP